MFILWMVGNIQSYMYQETKKKKKKETISIVGSGGSNL